MLSKFFFCNPIHNGHRVFFEENKGGEGGGGAGGSGSGGSGGGNSGGTVTLTKDQFDAIMARLPKEGSKGDPPPPDDDLSRKAALKREQDDKNAQNQKRLETSLVFTMGAKEWLKTNETLLPKTIEGIFTAAEKEKYNDAVEKADAIKVGIITEFFSLQANLDLLTPAMKSALEEFQKLTKTSKQERAQQIFDTVFEPAFETLRRVEKAKQLNNGLKNQSEGEKALADRMMKLSQKHYLGKES